jgi:hypothetical protein
MTNPLRRKARLAALALAAGVVLPACNVTAVQAPITLRADRRLKMVSPKDEDKVRLPTKVTWAATDFDTSKGNHFGVFVDRSPLGPRKDLRFRICTEQEKQPVQAGEDRKPCKDDRKTVFLTNETSFTFTCFEPKVNAPKRTRYDHTVTVILLDASNKRVGEAATSVKFQVNERDEKKCRGF